jgi:ferredoxin
MPGRIARIAVDRDLCIGSAICVDLAPEVFQLDDTATSTVIDPEGAPEEKLLEAARGCPTDAILLYDAAGSQIHPAR